MATPIIVVPPGTGVLHTLSAALSRGASASGVAAAGCRLAMMPHVAAAITGLAAILSASARVLHTTKYLGADSLVYVAQSTLRDEDTLTVADAPLLPASEVVGSGTLIKPKLTIFFFAVLAELLAPGESRTIVRRLGLSGVLMAVTFVVFAAYGFFAASVHAYVVSSPCVTTWLRRTCGGAFLAPGARLTLSEQ